MEYRYVASEAIGFVQIVSCNYIPHGYWYYVQGRVPEGKDPAGLDRKLIEKYRINVSRQTRWRKKQKGQANLHYVRHERLFVLLATQGLHRFHEEESGNIRDCRETPIRFGGYSISCKRGQYLRKKSNTKCPELDGRYRTRVQVARPVFLDWHAYFAEAAQHLSAERLAYELWNFPYEPYAPVRRQILKLCAVVNRVRKERGRSELDPKQCVRFRRRIVKPFEENLSIGEGGFQSVSKMREEAA